MLSGERRRMKEKKRGKVQILYIYVYRFIVQSYSF